MTTLYRVDLPGVDPSDIYVQAEGGLLSITGERKTEEDSSGYRETFYGKFERSLALPQGIEANKIAARYENGVLEIRVPLPAQLAGRKIPIQVEQNDSKKKLESKAA
jgi:HSP20 family protein